MHRLSTPIYLSLIVFILYMAVPPASAYPAQAFVTVKVIYPDGSPAQNMRVVLQNGNYAYLNNGMTNESGMCIFAVIPGSSVVRAIVTGSGYNATSIWQEAGDTTIEVQLPHAGELSGTIKLGGMGAGNPLVVLDDGEFFDSTPYDVSRQNSSELYTFTVNRFSLNTTLGDHRLYAVGYFNGTVYRSGTLRVNVSENTPQIVLELEPIGNDASILPAAVYDRIFHTSDTKVSPVSIAGTLTGADGKPLANATLTAQDYYMNEPGTTVTGADGSFAFHSISPGTDIIRFKAVIPDNGTAYVSYSPFYQAQNNSSLEVMLSDYPKPTVGYIYGIITMTGNRSNPVPVSGTVYLSNGMSQIVSPGANTGQFIFTVAPGPYEIYAEHVEGNQHLVSEKINVTVEPVWSPVAVNPTVLVVQPEKVQPLPLAIALVAGALCVAATGYAMRKWL